MRRHICSSFALAHGIDLSIYIIKSRRNTDFSCQLKLKMANADERPSPRFRARIQLRRQEGDPPDGAGGLRPRELFQSLLTKITDLVVGRQG